MQPSVRLQTHAALAGHSLGGALATLAAYDLATELALPHVHCITFGAPRVGNSVFVADYDRHVPNTWCPPYRCPAHMQVGGPKKPFKTQKDAQHICRLQVARPHLPPQADCSLIGLGQIVKRYINCGKRVPVLVRSCLHMPAKGVVRVKVHQDPGPRVGRHVINDQDAVTKAAKFVRLYRCCSARMLAPVSWGFSNFKFASGRPSRAYCTDCCSKRPCFFHNGTEFQFAAYKQRFMCSRTIVCSMTVFLPA